MRWKTTKCPHLADIENVGEEENVRVIVMFGNFATKEGNYMSKTKGFLKAVVNENGAVGVKVGGLSIQDITSIYSEIIAHELGVDVDVFYDVMIDHLEKTSASFEDEPVYEDPNEMGYDAFTGEPLEDDCIQEEGLFGCCYDLNGEDVDFDELPTEVQELLLGIAEGLNAD